MLSVARRLVEEAFNSGKIEANPAKGIASFRVNNETTHTVLTKKQAKELLEAIDRHPPLKVRSADNRRFET